MEKVCGVIKIAMATKPLNRVKKVLNGPNYSTFSVTNSFALLDADKGDKPSKFFRSYSSSSSSESSFVGWEYFSPPYK